MTANRVLRSGIALREARDIVGDGLREFARGRDKDGERVRVVLGLRDEIGGDEFGVA